MIQPSTRRNDPRSGRVSRVPAAGIKPHAIAHITGDGLLNLRRVEAAVGFELTQLPEPDPIFRIIEETGDIKRGEMRTVFNMGIGLTVVVAESDADKTLSTLQASGVEAWRIGHTIEDPERRVRIVPEGLIGGSKLFVPEEG